MTVDPKLTALLVTVLLVMAAPVAAHHKEGHAQGSTDEKAQQGPDSQDRGHDGSQDQARGPPDHAQGRQHAQSSLPGEEPSPEEQDDETTGSTDAGSATDDGQTSEEGSTTESTDEEASGGTDDGTSTDEESSEDTADDSGDDTSTETDDADDTDDTDATVHTHDPEDTSVSEEDPTPTFEIQAVDEPSDPAPGSEPTPEPDDAEGTAVDEPTTTESQAGSQAAFTGRLTPTTGQPLASSSLDGSQASQTQDTGVQAPASQAPGWDLAPLILIGLAALTGGGMATLRRRESQQEQAPPAPAATPGPTETPGTTETSETRGEAPGPSLPPGAPALLELAQEAVQREDYEGAIGWFEAAIALQPDLPVAHLCLGVCLSGLDRDEEALESLGHAAELAPGDPVPVYHQARILARMGRSPEALDQLARVVPVLPEEMVEALDGDEAFSSLSDHPRFLALTGRL